MADIYTYELDNSLYINLTNRCTNACEFCLRKDMEGVGGYKLWLKEEPGAQDVISQIKDVSKYDEIVFCGFGEPIIRLEELKEIARYVKGQGGKVRINTNGQGNLLHKRNIASELRGLVDVVSISLNAATAKKYDDICHSIYGEDAYAALLDFAKKCAEEGMDVVLSVVDVLDKDEIEECRAIAKEAGAQLRVRKKM